ncbi:MAG: DMT family transporter [Oceanospirillaceae bacterium]
MNSSDFNFKLGLIFALTAVLFWGMLPIALKLSADFIDPVTLTWFRFFIAFLVSIVLQRLSGKLSQFKTLVRRDWFKLTLAAACSLANYISFVYCLDYLKPGPAQLNFQTAPFFLAFGGVMFFKERLSVLQMTCFATLALGMLLFFHPYLALSEEEGSQVWIGILLVQFSAISWVCYALIQKALINKLSPGNVLLYIYGSGLIMMAPFSDFEYLLKMHGTQWAVALFCAFNTIVAYGCFGQAMKYWPTAQVGAMVALAPVFSFAFTALVVSLGWWSELITANEITFYAVFGIVLIVASVFAVQLFPLLKRKAKQLKMRNKA